MKRTLIALSLAAMALSYPAAYAKENGGITPQMLERMKAGMDLSPSKKAHASSEPVTSQRMAGSRY